MLVLVCGDREWTDRARIAHFINLLPADAVVMHGDCRGADRIAGEEAIKAGLEIRVYPADWSMGKSAGPRRNLLMLDQKPEIVIAFHSNLEKSRGTRHTVEEARRRGIDTYVINK